MYKPTYLQVILTDGQIKPERTFKTSCTHNNPSFTKLSFWEDQTEACFCEVCESMIGKPKMFGVANKKV